MNRETKTLLASIAVALAILWIFKPKKQSDSSETEGKEDSKFKMPKVLEDDKKKVQDNAVIGLQAMRDAINSGESSGELNKLKNLILKDYGIKVLINKTTKKLKAVDKKGNTIAEED